MVVCVCILQGIPLVLRQASAGEPEYELKTLITQCWAQNPQERPPFDQIRDRIVDMEEALRRRDRNVDMEEVLRSNA
jgi:hypothetical protein